MKYYHNGGEYFTYPKIPLVVGPVITRQSFEHGLRSSFWFSYAVFPHPGFEYNVANQHGVMLICWVDHKTAEDWLRYYNVKYAEGKPYPNGKGHYSGKFRIIKRTKQYE